MDGGFSHYEHRLHGGRRGDMDVTPRRPFDRRAERFVDRKAKKRTQTLADILMSLEPGDRQKVSVPIVVRPPLIAQSLMGRHGPPARSSTGPTGVADTAVGSASMFHGTTV